MKKLVTAVIVLVVCLAFAGCSAKENPVTHYKDGDVTLGQYKGIVYAPKETDITDEEFKDYLEYFCEQNPVLVDKGPDAVVENGNVVAMDFEGIRDGVAFEGGTGAIEDLEIGSNRFITSLEQGLIGKKVGECEVEATFPENYGNSDLAGVTVIFKCNIRTVSEKKIPEFDDEFASEHSEGKYATAEEYKAFLRSAVNDYQREQEERNKLQAVQAILFENCTINKDITEEVNNSKENLIKYYNEIYRDTYGCNASVFFRDNYGVSDAMFDQMMQTEAENQVKYTLIKSAVAEAEKIEVTEEEVKAFIKEGAEKAGYESEDEYLAAIEEGQSFSAAEYCEQQLRINKAEKLIMDSTVAE